MCYGTLQLQCVAVSVAEVAHGAVLVAVVAVWWSVVSMDALCCSVLQSVAVAVCCTLEYHGRRGSLVLG